MSRRFAEPGPLKFEDVPRRARALRRSAAALRRRAAGLRPPRRPRRRRPHDPDRAGGRHRPRRHRPARLLQPRLLADQRDHLIVHPTGAVSARLGRAALEHRVEGLAQVGSGTPGRGRRRRRSRRGRRPAGRRRARRPRACARRRRPAPPPGTRRARRRRRSAARPRARPCSRRSPPGWVVASLAPIATVTTPRSEYSRAMSLKRSSQARTYGQWLHQKATTTAGAPAASSREASPPSVVGRREAGAAARRWRCSCGRPPRAPRAARRRRRRGGGAARSGRRGGRRRGRRRPSAGRRVLAREQVAPGGEVGGRAGEAEPRGVLVAEDLHDLEVERDPARSGGLAQQPQALLVRRAGAAEEVGHGQPTGADTRAIVPPCLGPSKKSVARRRLQTSRSASASTPMPRHRRRPRPSDRSVFARHPHDLGPAVSSPAQAIGVFDSGVGGLTVLDECLATLPAEDFVYFGDTAFFPYGEKTVDELRRRALAIARWLDAQGVKLIVVACNTATAVGAAVAAAAGRDAPSSG